MVCFENRLLDDVVGGGHFVGALPVGVWAWGMSNGVVLYRRVFQRLWVLR